MIFPRATSDSFSKWSESFKRRKVPITAHHFLRRHDEPRHEQDFFEIQLCAGGSGKQQTAAGDLPFTRGDALLLRPGSWHYHHDNKEVNAYVCCFGPDLLRHELLWTLDDSTLNRLLWRPSPNKEVGLFSLKLKKDILQRCISHLEALAALGSNDDGSDRRARIGFLLLILDCLAESAVFQTEVKGSFSPVHAAVKRCVLLLDEHLAEQWTINGLAKKLNIDVSYLGRLFQSSLGTSPLAWLNQTRVERAAHILISTDKPIAQVGLEVGWPDPNHFAKRFRLHFGVSATEYRRRKIQSQRGES